MPTSDTDTVASFLAGIPVPVEPAAIERKLAALWKPASEKADGAAANAVTRVCLANVVVVGRGRDSQWIAGALDQLSRHCPCRMLWMQVDYDNASAGLSAAITALCHLPTPGAPQVCSELITLCSGRHGLSATPSAVLSLLEPDLPVALWWAMPAEADPGLFDALADLADRIVIHPEPLTSPALHTTGAVPCLRRCLRPAAAGKSTVLVWHTMSHWRELTAQFFDGPQFRDSLAMISKVTVRYAAPAGQPTAALPAALYAGWLAGQLGWQPVRQDGRATFEAATGRAVVVELVPQAADGMAAGRLLAVDIVTESGPSFHLARVTGERSEIRQALCLTESCTLLKSLPIVERDEGVWLGAAMESQSRVRVFPRAARIALWLLGA